MACAAAADNLLKVTDEQILEKMLAHLGILAYVAAALGISRTTVHKRVKNSPQLQQARDEAREAAVRLAEKGLLSAIHAGAAWAIRYTLNTLGRAEGFGPPFPQPRARKPNAEEAEPRVEVATELDDFRGEIADVAQMRLIWGIEEGQPWAIKYCLSTLGRSKGYGPPVAQAAMVAEPLESNDVDVDVDVDAAQTGVALSVGAQTTGMQTQAQTTIPESHRIEAVPEGAQTLGQRVVTVTEFASSPRGEESVDECANPGCSQADCANPACANPDCSNLKGANPEGAPTVQGGSTARHHCDPATRANRRRERKLRKQRVRENRRQSR